MSRLVGIFAAALLALPAAARGEGKPTQAEWDALKEVYKQRAKLAKHKEAAKAAADLAAKYPDDKDTQIFCAMTAYYCAHRIKDDEEKKTTALTGVECARRVTDKSPKDYDGRYWGAMTTFKSREAEGIMAALNEAGKIKGFLEEMIKDEPDRYEAYMLLGAMYRDVPGVISWGDNAKAIWMLEKAATLAPTDPEVLLELAAAYDVAGRPEEARKTYRKCIDESKAPKDRSWETEDAKDYARKKLKELEDK
jgi:tetratricopeptide (TPR) repeat protein